MAADGDRITVTYGGSRWLLDPGAADARVGDAVVFNLSKGATYASQVGLVVAVGGASITVVSGNAGSPSVSVHVATFVPRAGVSGYASPVA